MIGKLIVHGVDRADAIKRSKAALESMTIEGVATTIPFHLRVLDHPEFVDGSYDLTLVERML